MGDASFPREHIVCILPFPEPTEILKSIQKKHPNVTFNYINLQYSAKILTNVIPDGMFLPSLPTPTNTLLEEFKDATILCTLNSLPSSPSKAPNLKLIHFFSAGINQVQKSPFYTDTDIPITSSSGVHPPQIAEWVIMQILSSSHREKLLLQWQKEHKWGSHAEVGMIRDCVGQKFGVLGYGSIGRQGKTFHMAVAKSGADEK